MTILIDPRSGQPIYEQIIKQLRAQIVSGSLASDTPLPSVRSLAKDLGISVITTRRAYDELEAAGLIYTQPGRGSFVSSGGREQLRAMHLEELEETLRKLSVLRRDCGLSREELLALWERVEEELQ